VPAASPVEFALTTMFVLAFDVRLSTPGEAESQLPPDVVLVLVTAFKVLPLVFVIVIAWLGGVVPGMLENVSVLGLTANWACATGANAIVAYAEASTSKSCRIKLSP
jgi:hypothetical protein